MSRCFLCQTTELKDFLRRKNTFNLKAFMYGISDATNEKYVPTFVIMTIQEY